MASKKKQVGELTFDWNKYEEECKERGINLVTKPELFRAMQEGINADSEWTSRFPEITNATAKILYNHFMYVLGTFLIEEERSVRLDDIGILSLKFRKSRKGVAPYSFIDNAEGTNPTYYQSRPKRVMSIRRPFYFELDEDGNPLEPSREEE